MKRLSLRSWMLLPSILITFYSIGCSTNRDLGSDEFSNRTTRVAKRSVEEILSSIKAFSKVATERANSSSTSIPASRLKMAEFLSELKAVAPKKTNDETLRLSLGSWQEIWSDEQNPTPPGQKILKPNVYQVLREDGVGFNFGMRSISLPNGAQIVATSVIQLAFESVPESGNTKVTFLKTFSKVGGLETESSLAALAQGLLDGSRVNSTPTGYKQDEERRFPRGPIGAVGTLETVYIDEDIRIVQGPNPFSNVVDTFVLVRTDIPQ